MAVVNNISDRVAVMYLAKVCEVAPVTELFAQPLHPYTRALINPVPDPFDERTHVAEDNLIHGDIPSPGAHEWVPIQDMLLIRNRPLRSQAPAPREVQPGRLAACHY